jgi:hypothetical protein
MNDALDRYRLLSRADLDACPRRAGMLLVEVYLSEIALVVWLEVDSREPDDELQGHLQVTMRSLQDRLRGYGVDCPAVAVLAPAAELLSSGGGGIETFKKDYNKLAADQDWHRGEFLVFIEDSDEGARKRLTDLLSPQPPGQDIAASAQVLQDVVNGCKEMAVDNPLLSALVTAWEGRISKGSTGGPTTNAEEDAGVAAARKYFSPLQNEAAALLAELD